MAGRGVTVVKKGVRGRERMWIEEEDLYDIFLDKSWARRKSKSRRSVGFYIHMLDFGSSVVVEGFRECGLPAHCPFHSPFSLRPSSEPAVIWSIYHLQPPDERIG